MKSFAKAFFGGLLTLLAFGFFINLIKEQATWGTGAWTPRGREHAGTIVAAMLISTIPFALLLAGSLWGSLVLFKRAHAYRLVAVLELVFGLMISLSGYAVGIASLAQARSVEALLEGAFFVLLETAAGILLLYFAFRSQSMRGRAGRIVAGLLGVLLLLLSLLPLLAIAEIVSMTRFEGMRGTFITVLIVYALIALTSSVLLLVTAFRGIESASPAAESDRSTSGEATTLSTTSITSDASRVIPSFVVAPRPNRRKQAIVIAAVAVLVVIGVVIGLLVPNRRRHPSAPQGMVYVPGGEFLMGRDDGPVFERPAHKVTLKPFFIDTHEVMNEEFKACWLAGACRPVVMPYGWTWDGKVPTFPAGAARNPVTGVFEQDAEAYAKWVGKRVPSEAEWEFAARGTDGRRYPWGNEWMGAIANADGASHSLSKVGFYSSGVSPFGAIDMSGNASEWTSTKFEPYPGESWKLVLIVLNSERMDSYKLTTADIWRDLQNAGNVEIQTSGTFSVNRPWFLVLPKKDVVDLHVIEDVEVAKIGSNEIRLRDIGIVEEVAQQTKVVRGGSYLSKPEEATTTFRRTFLPSGMIDVEQIKERGFRCVKDVQ